jgi:hypothetical protein
VNSGRFTVEKTDIGCEARFEGGWTHGAGQNNQASQTKPVLAGNGEFDQRVCPLMP